MCPNDMSFDKIDNQEDLNKLLSELAKYPDHGYHQLPENVKQDALRKVQDNIAKKSLNDAYKTAFKKSRKRKSKEDDSDDDSSAWTVRVVLFSMHIPQTFQIVVFVFFKRLQLCSQHRQNLLFQIGLQKRKLFSRQNFGFNHVFSTGVGFGGVLFCPIFA